MPVEINGFQCNKCKSIHADFYSAQKCELKHGSNFEFSPAFVPGEVGPDSVKCTFTKENGDPWERHYY